MSLLHDAKRYALLRHADQRRDNATREPVALHLAEVSAYVADEGRAETVVAAAWLHDVVEDTDATLADVRAAFGDEVARLVDGLTDPDGYGAMPLTERKRRQAARLAAHSDDVKIIKLADQLSNVKRVIDDPPLDWDAAACLVYIEGAVAVAAAAAGVAPRLETLIAWHHARGVQRYGEARLHEP
jgi:GTP diphosphokinase / guanosine-3',5'-bis(diphosphate) 3'-diphosphatase